MTNRDDISERRGVFDSFWKTLAVLGTTLVLLWLLSPGTLSTIYVSFSALALAFAAWFDPLDHPADARWPALHACVGLLPAALGLVGVPPVLGLMTGLSLLCALVSYRVLAKGHSRVPDAPGGR